MIPISAGEGGRWLSEHGAGPNQEGGAVWTQDCGRGGQPPDTVPVSKVVGRS